VPVYNRPDEVAELLQSLENQTNKDFEAVIVEDGSTLPCQEICNFFQGKIDIVYFSKPNTGRSDTRNVGMQKAGGEYFVFTDSDCILPPNYFENLEKNLCENPADTFGGRDTAHESFTDVQKAINYAMTSFFTTGGIRGGKNQMEKFKPRTFNMGFSRKVFEKVGGFKNMFGEDIDLSLRIDNEGFSIKFYHDVFVYHKRRVSFKKFFRQIHNFGIARVNLGILHKGSLKIVHTAPAILLAGLFVIILLSIFCTPLWLILPALYAMLIFIDALFKTKKIKTAFLSLWASFIQISAYGTGFIKSFFLKIILKKGFESDEKLKKVYK
jgi:glycosyltransferase involved in cell wall biosynthesis